MKLEKRPPVKNNINEILQRIKQGKANAEAFAERCKPIRESMQKRVTV